VADLVLRRIDQLVPFAEASGEHLVAVMFDGVGGYLTLAQVNALVTGNAPEGLNTLSKIADAFGDDPEFLTKVNGALAKRLRFDAAQTLTIPERQQAQTNLGLLALSADFKQGLRISNNSSDPSNDIDIDVGSAKRGGLSVVNEAVITKRLDAAWSAGTGNGGLDTGAKTAGLTYHLHSLVNNTTGVFDSLFSLSVAAPTLPTGWSRVQRLGSVLVDGSGNIQPFTQVVNRFTLTNSVTELTETSLQALSAITLSSVPSGIIVQPILALTLTMSGAAATSGFTLALANGGNITSGGAINVATAVNTPNNTTVTAETEVVLTNTSRQIGRRTLAVGNAPVSPAFVLRGHGWTDISLGREA
jgi:hypothetical protein